LRQPRSRERPHGAEEPKTISSPEGPFPDADRAPPAQDGTRYELYAIGRALDDLAPAEKKQSSSGAIGVPAALLWAALTLVAAVALAAWLLLAPPMTR